MAKVKNSNTSPSRQINKKELIRKTSAKAMARDDLKEAFAGDENKGPSFDEKQSFQHSTNLKSRKTKESKLKTPIR